MLFDYGASMSIAFSNGTAFDFFLLRLWQSVCQEMESTLVSMQRVEERLDAVTSRDSLYPWDHLCDVVTEATPAWKRKAPGFKGRERLIKFFRDHHSSNTGLSLIPPLKHVETPTWSDHLILAGKLTASENGSVWQVSGSLSHPNRG
jgi:hypothetical protein